MKTVAKYNICKGVSDVLTLGTPITTLLLCSDFFIHRSETAISATGIFVIIITMMLFKDKIAEKWKVPSAFVLSTAVFVLLLLVEHIIQPMKYVCLATMIASGIDEITFKQICRSLEHSLPESAALYKHLGFIFANTDKLQEVNNETI